MKIEGAKEEQAKPYVGTAQSEGGGFHKFIPPRDESSIFDKKFIKSSIVGLNDVLGGKGYPPGSVINLVSVPKAGKTTLAIYEALRFATRGDDVLYIYNESIQSDFMSIVDRHREDLKLDRKTISASKLTFLDRHRKSPGTASYKEIESFVEHMLTNPIKGWLQRAESPKLIVIDSLTKFIRQYPAQSFVFAQTMMYNLKEMFKDGKAPVVLCISQKSSQFDKRDDESVLGGYGIVHDMDGSFVIRATIVDQWLSKETGLERGSKIRLFRVEDIRLIDADTSEHIFVKEKQSDGRMELIVGESLSEIINARNPTQ